MAGEDRGGMFAPVKVERKAMPSDRNDSKPTIRRSEISSPDIMVVVEKCVLAEAVA